MADSDLSDFSDDSDASGQFIGSSMNPRSGHCACEDAILKDWPFKHYDKEKDCLYSTFDDFGYEIWADAQGHEKKFYKHKHWGVTESYSHLIPPSHSEEYEKYKKEGHKISEYQQDNSVVPVIKQLLLQEKSE